MNPEFARHWALDPDVTFLTHGTYGATPWPVLHAQSEWRARMERQPVRFMNYELEGALDRARARLGEFLGAGAEGIAFVPNATAGVNTVLGSLDLRPGDEVLATDHDYNACLNAIREVAGRAGATAVVARVPFPLASADVVVDAVLERAGPRTRLAVLSHVTSSTALIFPIDRIVAALAERGIDTLVDGAHATGMVPLNVGRLGAAYYTGNAHKWLCAPKGAGFLHVRHDRREAIRPLVISHGVNSPRHDRSRFRLEFDWTGTADPSAYLSIPAALDFVASLVPGGWPEVMDRNRQLACVGRGKLLDVLGGLAPAPESMIGSMAVVELPADLAPPPIEPTAEASPDATWPLDPLHDELLARDAIEVPVYAWPHTPAAETQRRRLIRISAHIYNDASDYERLAAVLGERAGPSNQAWPVHSPSHDTVGQAKRVSTGAGQSLTIGPMERDPRHDESNPVPAQAGADDEQDPATAPAGPHGESLPDGQPVGPDNIRDGTVRGVMGGPNQSQGEGQGG